MAVGLDGFIGIGIESSGGTASQSVAVVDYLPFISENLAVVRDDLPDPSIWNNWDERRMYNGQQRIQGSIATVFHPTLSGYLMRLAFDACSATGGVLQSSTANIKEHVFITGQGQFQCGSGSDTPTATIEVNRGPCLATGSSFVYYNCTASALEISIEAGNMARLSVDLIGRDYSGKSRSTPAYVPQDAFLWNTASVSFDGAGTSLFQSLTVRLENNLQAIAKLDGRLRPDLLKRGDFRRVSVSGNTIFQTFTEYDRFTQGSEARLVVTFTGKNVNPTSGGHVELLQIDVPKFRYSTYQPAIGGPGPIQIGFTGRGMIDQVSGYALKVTVCNTRQSAYSVNAAA